jgi:hypothetical protein
MRRTRNITIAVSEEDYLRARLWAAHYGLSLSAAVSFLIANLGDIGSAVRMLRQKNPKWGIRTNN